MTDHEFLKLAAKAAGQDLLWNTTYRCWLRRDVAEYFVPWSPPTDDGDAFRLMVRLMLEPRYIDNSHGRGIEPSRVTMHNISGIAENIDGDPAASTRRAIVRAAAEIGKGMK